MVAMVQSSSTLARLIRSCILFRHASFVVFLILTVTAEAQSFVISATASAP